MALLVALLGLAPTSQPARQRPPTRIQGSVRNSRYRYHCRTWVSPSICVYRFHVAQASTPHTRTYQQVPIHPPPKRLPRVLPLFAPPSEPLPPITLASCRPSLLQLPLYSHDSPLLRFDRPSVGNRFRPRLPPSPRLGSVAPPALLMHRPHATNRASLPPALTCRRELSRYRLPGGLYHLPHGFGDTASAAT